jgi:phosphoadenosine phosphosulfate reductase
MTIPIDNGYCPVHAIFMSRRGHGVNLFYASVERRRQCCGVRKVDPLGRALAGLRPGSPGFGATRR